MKAASRTSTLIEIPAGQDTLRGILGIPAKARGIVVFVHGHDSSSLSPRNRLVARLLFQQGFAVLQADLTNLPLADRVAPLFHERDGLLQTANRLIAIVDWVGCNPGTSGLRIGLFGACSGAAAALIAAALRPSKIHAVVSRGGRMDLADEVLPDVQAPTLMLIGSKDQSVIDHNRKAHDKMRCKPMIELIHGASHLFGEPGTLEQVASMTCMWFQRTLPSEADRHWRTSTTRVRDGMTARQ